jgi:Pyruvate/2-oxoglutarate dehydrogenase complex, dihydrolipoamide dehydrogenase (E3) component, and related enzymes
MASFDYDVVIIGSGFGGSVAALRAARRATASASWNPAGAGPTKTSRRASGTSRTSSGSPRGALRSPEDRVPRRRARPLGRRRRRRLACVREHDVRPTEAVLRRERMGRHHRLGRRAGAVLRPGREDVRRRPLPVHATDVDRAIKQVANDIGRGETHNKAHSPSTSARRESRPRIRISAGSGRGAPADLVRQLQQRLRPQRQEQADDELPLPSREAGRAVHDMHEVFDLVAARGGGFEVHARHPGWAQRAGHSTTTRTPPSR